MQADARRKGTDVLLAHAYYSAQRKNDPRRSIPCEPVELLTSAAYWKQHGFSLKVFDATFQSGPAAFEARLLEYGNGVAIIQAAPETRRDALDMIRRCRKHGVRSAAIGPDPSLNPQCYAAGGAEWTVVGDPEETVLELLHRLRSRNPAGRIPGIYSGPGGLIPRRTLTEPDALPFPDRTLIDMQPYLDAWRRYHGFSCLHIAPSRGCYYRCAWCPRPADGEKFRLRSPRNVVLEMAALQAQYRPDRIWLLDDVLGSNAEWVGAFAREIRRNRVRMPFECLLHVGGVEPECLRLLRETGCCEIWFTADSGSQRMLDKMNKGITVAQIERAAALTRAAGIPFGFHVKLGSTGETDEDIDATRRMLKAARPDYCDIAVADGGDAESAEAPLRMKPLLRRLKRRLLYAAVKRLIAKDQRRLLTPDERRLERWKIRAYQFGVACAKRIP